MSFLMYSGQSAIYYFSDEFLKNKEFSLFKNLKLILIDDEIFFKNL